MRWFKCINPESEEILAAVNAVGKHGAFECLCIVAEAIDHDIHNLNIDVARKWADVKKDRAERILPFAQKILDKSWKIYRKSIRNLSQISENLAEISENLVDFDASNPHHSTRDIKEEKEEEKETPTPLKKGDDLFEKFWAEYPSKKGKKTAWEAWRRKNLDEKAEVIMAGLKAQVATEQWQRGIIPNPATFINQERWNDEATPPKIINSNGERACGEHISKWL